LAACASFARLELGGVLDRGSVSGLFDTVTYATCLRSDRPWVRLHPPYDLLSGLLEVALLVNGRLHLGLGSYQQLTRVGDEDVEHTAVEPFAGPPSTLTCLCETCP